MTDLEFDMAMRRVTETFPNKGAYTEERLKLIFKATRSLPAHAFNRIVDHFVANSRYAPLPKDFLEAAAKERVHLGESIRQWTSPPPIACKWCNDGGVMEVEGKQTRNEYFIRCGCEAGRFSIHRDLPRWTSSEFGQHFIAHAMFGERALRWKPKNFDPSDSVNSLHDKLEEWKLKLDLSKAFWREWFGQSEEPA